MGDRGETATSREQRPELAACNFIRWEIGEKPQRLGCLRPQRVILSDRRSGRNRNLNSLSRCMVAFYPMGDRGETATESRAWTSDSDFIRWEIGEKPQLADGRCARHRDFIRWEIGEKPQHGSCAGHHAVNKFYPMGDRGETATSQPVLIFHLRDFIRWEIGEKPQPGPATWGAERALFYPMGDRGETATGPTSSA